VQARRFDPDGAYVRRFVPELRDAPHDVVHEPWRAPLLRGRYPAPIVSHAERRELALLRYQAVRAAGAAP
jgi:deoxyribodipyrimidine photo-lyase